MTAATRAREDRAILALLSTPTRRAAAQRTGISERTLDRYLADPGFARRYSEARAAAYTEALADVQAAASEAVSALRRNLRGEDPKAEVAAARTILDFALRARDRE
jgi:hypothetical protein